MRSVWRWVCAGLFLGVVLAGCYTPEELRAKADAAPDPREAMLSSLWASMEGEVEARGWPIELSRQEDLLVVTPWMAMSEPAGLHRRVRLLALITPRGVGINATIRYARLNAEGSWEEDVGERAAALAREEEESLVRAVYARWQEAL